MGKMELIEVNELKAYLVKLYSPGDQDVTETDRVVNRIFDFLEVLPVVTLTIPTQMEGQTMGCHMCTNKREKSPAKCHECPYYEEETNGN